MAETQTPKPLPKKGVMVTITFPIESDTEAIEVKQQLNEALKDVKDKRFTFQIFES